jgi:pimeloyl-ACP methyl ester carboxylesterase
MKVLRTPDSAFAAIDDFPFAPNYVEIADPSDGTPLRVHYVDEGPRDAPVVLMMHGEPSWSYLYRHMIGPVVAAGFRVVAPDLIGFGKSDKPTKKTDYSYARHVGWMRQWIEAVDLSNMTLVCQDWGSLIGLRLVAEMPDRFASVVLSNGGLPEGGPPPRAFAIWQSARSARLRSPLMTRRFRTAAIKPVRGYSRASFRSRTMSRSPIRNARGKYLSNGKSHSCAASAMAIPSPVEARTASSAVSPELRVSRIAR